MMVFRLQSEAFPPTTTTTLTPFGAEQVRLQTEYANRAVTEQLTNEQQRSRPRTFAQPPLRLQVQPVSQLLQQHRQPQRFSDQNEKVRLQNILPLQQQEIGPDPQQDFGPAPSGESYSYAQVQIGAVSGTRQPTEPGLVARPKGQRSVSRPRANHPVPEQVIQQTIDHPTTIFPVQFSPRLLQNVVYIQPNGQIHKPIEDAEQVVEIPRRNYFYGHSSELASAPLTVASVTASTPVTSAPANPVGDEPLVLIPRLKKPDHPTEKIRQDGRKTGRVQQQQQSVKTARPLPQQQLQKESEVEPDNFLTSLLYRLQQQQQQDVDGPEEPTVAAVVPKQRGGQRTIGAGNRPDASKYLPDRNQLQLLQFPHELHSLSSAELRALDNAGAQITAANDQFVGQKRLSKNRPVAVSSAKQSTPPPPETLSAELFDDEQNHHQSPGNRPVPTPVELNKQQREFLAAQGIRNLYRVDYDQSGNVLPLTYVLALDNRPKRAEQQRLSATATNSDTNIKNN